MVNSSALSADSCKRLLGERIKQERIARDLTQRRCAFEAGISLRTQVRLEKGESDSLAALIQVLQVLKLEEGLLRLIPDRTDSPLARSQPHSPRGKPRQRVRTSSAKAKATTATSNGKGWRGFKDPVSFGDDD
ncbi:XRE family transcriptional regulator [Pseudomaricurvus alcaniphilus]|uniref:helix-turn-helix domain-containing protein n=1 Tax=Pseudomaricurvus alcaniphilus TaxID=1166482 RepID=UPI00140A7ADB|nr:XRE family transcriptional regulator [Pseudomaricurvus alcaniphilus]NHN35730.1 XRE family transcriptional regulator [Pseudomaricurvus alcaniphilus]